MDILVCISILNNDQTTANSPNNIFLRTYLVKQCMITDECLVKTSEEKKCEY